MKRMLLWTWVLILSPLSGILAQTDVTSKYLTNPSFEMDNISTLSIDGTRNAYIIDSNL